MRMPRRTSTDVIGASCWVGGWPDLAASGCQQHDWAGVKFSGHSRRSITCRQGSAARCSQKPGLVNGPRFRMARSAHFYRTDRPTRLGPAVQPRRPNGAGGDDRFRTERVHRGSSFVGHSRSGGAALVCRGHWLAVPLPGVTIGSPVVCSSGRRRLSSVVPITGTRRLRLAVRGPVEQLGVLATLSRWRSRVQIPSGPQGLPVRSHRDPSQVR